MISRVLATACLLILLALPCPAQTPAQVKDINPSLTGGTWLWPYTADFVEIGSTVYFQVWDGIHGIELWKSDGTEAGTALVKDICPGACSSAPRNLTVAGTTLWFAADDGAHGPELWKSDGTAAGTVLVADLAPGLAGSSPHHLFEINGALCFSLQQESTGDELWISDGTAAGTVLLNDLWPGTGSSSPAPLARLGNVIFLSAEDGTHGRELWKTDGTAAGTVLVKDINPGSGWSHFAPNWPFLPGYAPAVASAGRIYFGADDGTSGNELWASDGTAAGTVLVKDIDPGTPSSTPSAFLDLGGTVLFRAIDGTHGNEPWASDGTEAGTVRVKDIHPGTSGSSPHELVAAGGWAWFRANDGVHGWEVWKTDGSEANTTLLKDINPGSASGIPTTFLAGFAAVGTRLVFFADDGTNGHEPWTSDGTEAGTTLLADLNPGSGPSQYALYGILTDRRTVSGGRWWFRAYDGEADAEVYVSDGTPAGTQQLAEINAQTSAFDVSFLGVLFGVNPLADRNGTLFFQASDGLSGHELWKSDGSAAGTEPVADIAAGAAGSQPYDITPLGGSVLFSAMDSPAEGRELWVSDGTAAGTALLKDLEAADSSSGGWPWWLTPFGGRVFFTTDGSIPAVLWQSDGTAAGTTEVHPEGATVQGPTELTPVGGFLFYSASGPGGAELWKTDGTAAGTVQVKDIAPGAPSSTPDRLTRVGSRLFFSADDGASGRELWASDGTAAGTSRVKDILPGAGSAITLSWDDLVLRPKSWAALDGRLLFMADGGTGSGEELWVSDGSAAGTFEALDIFPGARSAEVLELTGAGNRAFFVAEDGTHGRELWVSDGTAGGTRLVADLNPGPGSSLPGDLTAVGTQLLFSAHTPDGGRELWTSDGWSVGTRRLADLAPGATPSSPQALTFSGPWLYLVANDGIGGFELFSVPREEVDGSADFFTLSPCRLLDTRLGGGPLEAGTPRTFPAAGLCGIPATARALVVNVTTTQATATGELLVYRAGTAAPGTVTQPFQVDRNLANNAVVQLGDGDFEAVVTPAGVSVHLIVDVTGYYE